jgi:hypothetical protein
LVLPVTKFFNSSSSSESGGKSSLKRLNIASK